MALLRGLGRAAPLLAAGLAAAWYLRRQGLLGAPPQPELAWPPDPAPEPPPPAEETRVREVMEPPAPPVVETTQVAEVMEQPDPAPEEQEPIDAHVEAVEAVSDAADVTSVVEDLLAGEIVDAEVVEEGDLEARVHAALGENSGSVRVESYRGIVWLRGELEPAEAIDEAERRAGSVSGVTEVRNLLHLPGTPPPSG